ncbi:MAG: hypothetical protein ABF946_02875 [Acetobacter papayae]
MARKPGFIPEQPGFAGFDRVGLPQGPERVRRRVVGGGQGRSRRPGTGARAGQGDTGPESLDCIVAGRVVAGLSHARTGVPVSGVAVADGGQADLFSQPLPPLPRTVFLPEEVRLSPVAVASLGGRSGEDGCLYLVATQIRAARLLEQGLPLSRRAPLMLTERAGVVPWLAWLSETGAEEQDAGPGVVLRLRRAMVAEMLESDPDHTAAFSAPCYWLSGV